MSTEVDNRVVEMQFDNKQFESGVQETIKSLEKLNKSLQLEDSAKGFENISNAARKVDLSGISNAIEGVSVKFSALQIAAFSVIDRITNKALDAGESLAKSLSIDQITSGYSKYDSKTGSMQTLVNTTGRSVEDITNLLDKIYWYSDETSYSADEMVKSISTIVSQGGKLEDAVDMATGVANAVAFAGKGATEFQYTIRNVTDAMSKGYLNAMDWRSIQNQGTNSQALVEAFIKAGEEAGTIKKGAVTIANFKDSLEKKWADTTVMQKAFNSFAEMSNAIYDISLETGETATEIIPQLAGQFDYVAERAFKAAQEAKTFREAIDATKDAVSSQWSQTFEYIFGNYEEATKLWTFVANELYDIFAEPRWEFNELMAEWSELGGRTKLFEGIAAVLSSIKVTIRTIGSAFRKYFPKKTGEDLYNLTEKISNFFKENLVNSGALKKIYITFDGFFSLIKSFKDLAYSIITSIFPGLRNEGESFGSLLLTIAANIGTLLKQLSNLINNNSFFTVVLPAAAYTLGRIANIILNVLLVGISKLLSLFNNGEIFIKIKNFFVNGFQIGSNLISGFVSGVTEKFKKTYNNVISFFSNIIEGVKSIFQIHSPSKLFKWIGIMVVAGFIAGLSTIEAEAGTFWGDVVITLQKGVGFLGIAFDTLGNIIKKAGESLLFFIDTAGNGISKLFDWIKNAINNVWEFGGNVLNTVKENLDKLFGKANPDGKTFIENMKEALAALNDWLRDLPIGKIAVLAFIAALLMLSLSVSNMLSSFRSLLDSINSFGKTLRKLLARYALKSGGFLQVSIGIALIAASIASLAYVASTYDLLEVAESIGIVLAAVTIAMVTLNQMTIFSRAWKTIMSLSTVMLSLSVAFISVAYAFKMIESLNTDAIWTKLAVIGSAVAGISVIATIITFITKNAKNDGFLKFAMYVLALSSAISILAKGLQELSSIAPATLESGVNTLLKLMIGIGFLALGAGQVKLGSLVGVWGIFKLFGKILPNIVESINSMQIDKVVAVINAFQTSLEFLLVGIGLLAITMAALSKPLLTVGKSISSMMFSLTSVILGIIIFSEFLEKQFSSGEGQVSRIVSTSVAIVTVIGVLVILSAIFSKAFSSMRGLTASSTYQATFKAMNAMLWGVSGLLLSIAVFTKMINKDDIYSESLFFAVGIVAGLLWGISKILNYFGKMKFDKQMATGIKDLKWILISISVLMAEIAAMSLLKVTDILPGLLAVGTAALILIGILGVFSKISSQSIKIKQFLALTLVLGALGGLIFAMMQLSNKCDPDKLLTVSKAIRNLSLGLSAIVAAVGFAGMLKGNALSILSTALAAVLLLAGIVGALYVLDNIKEFEKISAGLDVMQEMFIKLIEAIGILTVIGLVLGKFTKFVGLIGLAIGIGSLLAVVGAFAISLDMLSNKIKELANSYEELSQTANTEVSVHLLTELPLKAKTAGKMFVEGITAGLKDSTARSELISEIKDIADSMDTKIREGLDEHSPSKKGEEAGFYYGEGIAIGVADSGLIIGNELKAILNLFVKASEGITKTLSRGAYANGIAGDPVTEAFCPDSNEVAEATEQATAEVETGMVTGWKAFKKTYLDTIWPSIIETGETIGKGVQKGVQKLIGIDGINESISSVTDLLGGNGGLIEQLTGEGGLIAAFSGGEDATLDMESALAEYENTINELLGGEGGSIYKKLGIEDPSEQAEFDRGINGMRKTFDEIEDIVKGSIDIFSEFELAIDKDYSIDKLINNMTSNILGVQHFADNLSKAAANGLSQGLIEELYSKGPREGYKEAEVLANATAEEIQHINNLYTTSLSLPKFVANQIEHTWQYAGDMAKKGYSKALDNFPTLVDFGVAAQDNMESIITAMLDPKTQARIKDAGKKTGETVIDGEEEGGLGEEGGKGVVDDLNKGIIDELESTADEVAQVASWVGRNVYASYIESFKGTNMKAWQKESDLIEILYSTLNKYGHSDVFKTSVEGIEAKRLYNSYKRTGSFAIEGFKNGMITSEHDLLDWLYTMCSKCEDIPRSAWEINSPSRVFAEIGRYAIEGLTKGISDNGDQPENEFLTLSDRIKAAVQDAYQRIIELINGDSISPVISPVLDLSNVQNGANSIGNLFSSKQAIAASAEYYGNASAINAKHAEEMSMLSNVRDSFNDASNRVVDAINNTDKPINVTLNVTPDSYGLFRTVRAEAIKFNRANGYNAFV